MALGDNNTSRQSYDPTYYPRLNFKNTEEALQLSYQFWKGMIKLIISEEKKGESGFPTYSELIYVHISPMKARVLVAMIRKEQEEKTGLPIGVNLGIGETQNVIAITINPDTQNILLALGKVDNSGKIIAVQYYPFVSNYNYGIKWNDFDKMDIEKEYLDGVEFAAFVQMLENFASSSDGTVAYSVADVARFETSKLNTKIGLIMEALNIDRKSGGYSKKGNSGGGSSYFNNGGAASHENSSRAKSANKSYGDIESMIDD